VRTDIAGVVVSEERPLVEALAVLDESAGKILFVTREGGVLAGVLTDG